MKQELTKLRIEVSEGPIVSSHTHTHTHTHTPCATQLYLHVRKCFALQQSDIGTIQDVISTLQYDVQSVHNKIQVEKTQGVCV